MNLLQRFKAWRKRRYWNESRQLEHLRLMVQGDHRWLAHDKTADALTTRYLSALAPDWYSRVHTDVCNFRREIGLEPAHGFGGFGSPEHIERLSRALAPTVTEDSARGSE